MQLRQNRRRRVLSDESAGLDLAAEPLRPGRSAGDAASGGTTRAPYSEAVERDQARRILDLLPTRYLTLTLLFLLGTAIIAALEALYGAMPRLARLAPVEDLAAIDLAGGRSLANWFSSCLLGATGMVALLIYSLRRHRGDDYHGRYRLWLWTAAAMALLNMDEICDLHRLGPALLASAAAWCSMSAAQLWGLVAGITAGILLIRMLLEVRRAKLAVATLLAAAGCLAGVTVCQQGWIPLEPGIQATMIQTAMRMVGHLLLALALILYARHVVRDAAGLVPLRKRKPARKKAARSDREKSADAATHVDPPQTSKPHFSAASDLKSAHSNPPESRIATTQSTRQPAVAAKSASPATFSREEQEAQAETRGMTRAERKKLRRQMKQERFANE